MVVEDHRFVLMDIAVHTKGAASHWQEEEIHLEDDDADGKSHHLQKDLHLSKLRPFMGIEVMG